MSFKRSPAWKVYKEQMSQLDNGDALWEPTPLDYFKRIQIGDVGYIRRACFHLLFSAGKPLGERQLGVDVPLAFESLDIGPIIHFQSRLPGHLSTDPVRETGVGLEDPTGVVPVLEPGFSVLFESTEKQGAALVTKYSTYREDIQREQNFEEYTKRHYDSWVTFARETGHGNDINPLLVTGVDMTRDFAMMSYSSNGVHLKSEFTVSAPGVSSASAWGTWRTGGLVQTNCGPQPCLPPSATQAPTSVPRATDDIELISEYNQCVFVRYYTMRKRPLFAPKLMKAGAGPHDLGPGDRSDESPCKTQCDSDSENASSLFDNDGSGDRSSVTSMDSEPDVVVRNTIVDEGDDFDAIVDYVFQNSDANSVIVHNRDLALFRKAGSGTHASLFSSWQSFITVDRNGVGKIKFCETDHTAKFGCEDFGLDEQLEGSTAFNNDVFADWLVDEQVTRATSPGQSTTPPFYPFIAPSSPSVASSPFSSRLSTPLRSLPPDHKDSLWEFVDTPQHPGSMGGVFSYDEPGIHTDGYLQAPAWAANLWDNSAIGDTITDVQFPAQAVTTATMGPPHAHQRESSLYNMFGSPPSPPFIDPHGFSPSPTLVDVENPVSTPALAIRPRLYPTTRYLPVDLSPFLSTSAPSAITPLSTIKSLGLPRSYACHVQSIASGKGTGDPNTTTQGVPERSQQSRDESCSTSERSSNETMPQKLRPPKLAPSAWQLYFTDFIRRAQKNNPTRINVAQAAKEAGQEYANLSVAEKEKYKHMSRVAKDAREREYANYLRALTPEDIKRDNSFRTAQRRAGKSRGAGVKDPNAPKKPLSAYFTFLQKVRSDPGLVKEIFGDETETTRQSVLAAAKWRSMTDDERKPFLSQAEQDKLDYEAARELYENGSIAHGSNIDFGTGPFLPRLGTTPSLSPKRTNLHLDDYLALHVGPESTGSSERSAP